MMWLRSIIFILIAVCSSAAGPTRPLTIAPEHANGAYAPGEPIRWRIQWQGEGAPSSVGYKIMKGGLTPGGEGTLDLVNLAAVVESRLDAPGTLLLEVRANEQRAVGGAVVAPDAIKPSTERPTDFDEFWASKLREARAVEFHDVVLPLDSGKPGTAYWTITLDNIRGSKIRGQIARPAADEKFPALLIAQWAGVYPLEKHWVIDRAAEGWLVLNISAHDLPIDEPESFYKHQREGPLKDYWAIGNDDRETSCFLRMYLSCVRAADYLAKRADWDGKTLVVMGGSQGGQQALVTAALHRQITAAVAGVPAGCDMRGPDAGRLGGWPQWHGRTTGKDPEKVRRASEYFDVVNFASRITCPVLIGVGLVDEVCPPAGIFAAAGEITSPKQVVILPGAGHQNENDSHRVYEKNCWEIWLPALRQGKPAPIQATE
jgi:cephalosporin-C deacetylase